MVKKNIPRPYNAGTMTESEARSFIISAIRQKSRWWKAKTRAIARARVRKGEYKCESCWTVWPASLPPLPWRKRKRKNIQADHIHPVVPLEGFKGKTFLSYNWTEYIKRMFVEEDDFQAICWECHSKLTKEENAERRKFKKNNKWK